MSIEFYAQAQYLCSALYSTQFPVDEGCEVAFVGRSNVGKSSAINRITQQKSLARTSKTPGRTQQLIFFRLTAHQRLVDLPGYGFAKVPFTVKQQWQRQMTHYLHHRHSLKGIVLLIDSRHPMMENDWQMLQWCQAVHMPVHILLTKADKLSYGRSKATLQQVQQQLDSQVSIQLFSATKAIGIDEIRRHLTCWLGYVQGIDQI